MFLYLGYKIMGFVMVFYTYVSLYFVLNSLPIAILIFLASLL